MASTTKDLGRVMPVAQGAYSTTKTYVPLDIVTYNGSSYICLATNTGKAPTDMTYWQSLAMRGSDGPAGPAGKDGATGAKGDTGPQGPKGDQGPQGERGKQIFKSSYEDIPHQTTNYWSDLSPTVSVDNPPQIGDTVITPAGKIFQIDTVSVGGGGGGGTFGVGDVLGNIKGPSGKDGATGPAGATGPQGIQGVKGDKGDTGPAGPKGDTGSQGPTGPIGPQGPAGQDAVISDTGWRTDGITLRGCHVVNDGAESAPKYRLVKIGSVKILYIQASLMLTGSDAAVTFPTTVSINNTGNVFITFVGSHGFEWAVKNNVVYVNGNVAAHIGNSFNINPSSGEFAAFYQSFIF